MIFYFNNVHFVWFILFYHFGKSQINLFFFEFVDEKKFDMQQVKNEFISFMTIRVDWPFMGEQFWLLLYDHQSITTNNMFFNNKIWVIRKTWVCKHDIVVFITNDIGNECRSGHKHENILKRKFQKTIRFFFWTKKF